MRTVKPSGASDIAAPQSARLGEPPCCGRYPRILSFERNHTAAVETSRRSLALSLHHAQTAKEDGARTVTETVGTTVTRRSRRLSRRGSPPRTAMGRRRDGLAEGIGTVGSTVSATVQDAHGVASSMVATRITRAVPGRSWIKVCGWMVANGRAERLRRSQDRIADGRHIFREGRPPRLLASLRWRVAVHSARLHKWE